MENVCWKSLEFGAVTLGNAKLENVKVQDAWAKALWRISMKSVRVIQIAIQGNKEMP